MKSMVLLTVVLSVVVIIALATLVVLAALWAAGRNRSRRPMITGQTPPPPITKSRNGQGSPVPDLGSVRNESHPTPRDES
jgi:hypothetical protein